MTGCPVCCVPFREAEIDGKPRLVCPSCYTIAGDRPRLRVAEVTGERPGRNDEERRMQVRLMEIIRAHEDRFPDLRWVHHSPGEVSSPARARIMREQGTRAGVLDLEWPLIAVQRDPFGEGTMHYAHGLGIELKAGRNQPTPAQRDRMEWLEHQGWQIHICRSVSEAWRQILRYCDLYGRCPCPDCEAAHV